MKISIIIPNWNGSQLLKKHLPRVLESVAGAEVIIVDDASQDDSIEILHLFPKIRIIKKHKHEGFASSVNEGVRNATGDIVILLNTDIEPRKDFLKPLLSHFTDPSVFAVGCMDESIENGKTVLRGRGEGAWIKGFYIHRRGETNKSDTAWVSGGSGAFKKDIWQKLGGMDTLFNPFYWEDIDLSYRALKSGYVLLFEPKSIVKHFHQEGKILQTYTPRDIKTISYRNQFVFIWKNASNLKIILEHSFWTPVRIVQSIIAGDFAFIKGYLSAVALLPKILTSRMQASKFWKRKDSEITSPFI